MALEHQNVSISEATAALSGAAAQDAWRDALLDHASGAWTLVEEFDSTGATVHWVVIKNDHTLSGYDIDFFVVIGRKAADGQMGVMVGETYDSPTNVLGKYAPLSLDAGTILADDTYGHAAAMTWTLTATWPDLTTSNPLFGGSGGVGGFANVATERLFTSVDEDYAVLNVNGTSMYVGALTDLIVPQSGLVATPALGCFNLLNGSGGEFGAITRAPVAAADAPMSVYHSHSIRPITPPASILAVCMQLQAFLTGLYGYGDRYQSNRVSASEIAAVMEAAGLNTGANNTAAKVGNLRAKFKGLRWTTGPIAAVPYDDIDVDGNKAVVLSAVGGLITWSPYVSIPLPYQYALVAQPLLVMDTGIPA